MTAADVVVYLLAGISYVLLAASHKWLLNWIIGPLWLVAWVWAADRIVARRGRRERS